MEHPELFATIVALFEHDPKGFNSETSADQYAAEAVRNSPMRKAIRSLDDARVSLPEEFKGFVGGQSEDVRARSEAWPKAAEDGWTAYQRHLS